MGPLAVSEVVPRNATKCAGNRSVNAKFWRGTYRGTVVNNGYIIFVFSIKESLGGNHIKSTAYKFSSRAGKSP